MIITVFTPTYNRAKLLNRLYQSLCQQTYEDFEWIIVNDGSKDNTDEVVQSFIAEKKINIHYIRQKNGGKHRAINNGVKEAKGELFFIADSDDWLPFNAIEIVMEQYNSIKNDNSFGGVCGLDAFDNGEIIGSCIPKDFLDCTTIEAEYKYHIYGDKKEVFKTSVLKEFPFPEYKDERFSPENLVWNRIATKYKLRYFNKVIYTVEYQLDGISHNIIKERMNSPIASTSYYQELLNFDIPLKKKIKGAINYWRFRFCGTGQKFPQISKKWFWTMPIGWVIHLNDKRVCQ